MTVIAVIAAYLTDSMPLHCITDTDQAFINNFQRLWSRLSESPPVLFIGLCWIILSKLVLRRRRTPIRMKRTREQRETSFTKFILTLSDQQLVVGLAILVAAVSNQCTLFIEEFRIAFALAWFSSTTHLATLDNLRYHFHECPHARNRRVTGMLALLGLFIYCFSIIYLSFSYGDSSRPVQCYIDGRHSFSVDSSVYGRAIHIAWITTLIFVVNSYKDRIIKSYTLPTNESFGTGLISAKLGLHIRRIALKLRNWNWNHQSYRELYNASLSEWSYVLNEANHRRWSAQQRMFVIKIRREPMPPSPWSPALTEVARQSVSQDIWELRDETKSSPKRNVSFIHNILLLFTMSNHVYQRSFLSQAPSLAFMLTYGLTQLIHFRWLTWFGTPVQESRSMGFGQITPIFLLILPVVAAMEIFTGMVLLHCFSY